MDQLPEDCVGHIFSFTSPLDACRLCPVSRETKKLMDSDETWKKFLPSDYEEILSRIIHPIDYSSKKELFFKLSTPHLIDMGMKIFWLDKQTGKKCYALSARDLSFIRPNGNLYWSWNPLPGSRFGRVLELRAFRLLEIQGSIKSSALSANTNYRVYLIIQIKEDAYGLHKFPFEMTIENGKHKVQTMAYISKHNVEKRNRPTSKHVGVSSITRLFRFGNKEGRGHSQLRMRKDGMLEIELGKFCNHEGDGKTDEEIKMSLKELKGLDLKGGLVVEGMEIIARD